MNLGALQIQAIVDATKTPTPEQVRVVEAPRRPLLVVAGAGSGKTETMSMRVLWLLANHPDLTPSSILGLTFTRKAAGELGERLRERIRLLSREMPQLRERLDEDPVALTTLSRSASSPSTACVSGSTRTFRCCPRLGRST